MLKLLQNWDRKLESFIHEMDRTLQEPITRSMTFEVFRQNGTHAADQPVTAEAAINTDGALDITANTSSAPVSPSTLNRDYHWDYYPSPDGRVGREAMAADFEREGAGCLSCSSAL